MCEFAYKTGTFQFLMCRKMGENPPENAEKAAKRMCMFQRYCALKHKYENTESADRCLIKNSGGNENWNRGK